MKLKDYCERLILKDPVGNARKTEELLWRKAFYDVVYTAKKLRKVIDHLDEPVKFYDNIATAVES